MQRRITSFFLLLLIRVFVRLRFEDAALYFSMFGKKKKKVESIEKRDDKKLRERGVSFFALEVRGSSGKKIDKTRNLRCLHRRDISFPNDEQV